MEPMLGTSRAPTESNKWSSKREYLAGSLAAVRHVQSSIASAFHCNCRDERQGRRFGDGSQVHLQVGIRTLRCEAAPTPTVAALRTAPRRRDLAAYGRLWRTPCYRFSFMNAAGLP